MHTRQKHCEFCGRFFIPDRRTGNRQRCCLRPQCCKKRKAASQTAWVLKNSDYFKDRYEITKKWREEHPGYQRQRRKKRYEIQDEIPSSSPMKSVRLLVPVKWFKDGIQDAKAVVTVIDSDTCVCTDRGVRYKTRLAEVIP